MMREFCHHTDRCEYIFFILFTPYVLINEEIRRNINTLTASKNRKDEYLQLVKILLKRGNYLDM